MKLGGVDDGRVYVTAGLDVGQWRPQSGFDRRGRVPGSQSPAEVLLNARPTRRLLSHVTGHVTLANLWPIGAGRLLATNSDGVYLSTDRGQSWSRVHSLPASAGPMGVLPTSVCRHDGRVYLAEYPLGGEPARVLVSEDGAKWSPFVSRTDVRHFHGVFRDPYSGDLWGTTGDTDGESAIGRFESGEFRPVGRGSQRWRAVELAFTPDAVFWGMDCPYTDRVEILRLDRDAIRATESDGTPEPDVVATVDAPVFYAETVERGKETWVVLSTAATTGLDSTAPPGARRQNPKTVEVLAASDRTGYGRWHRIAQFERSTPIGEYVSSIPTTNAYVFISWDPDLGLLLNPFNTTRDHGAILSIPPSWFETEVTEYAL